MNAGQLATTSYLTVSPYDGISSIEGLMLEKKYAVVKNKGEYRGLLVPTDIMSRSHALVIDCLTSKPDVSYDDDIMDVFFTALKHNISILPVFREGIFHGVITLGSIITYQREHYIRTQSCFEEILRSIDEAVLMYDVATGRIVRSNAGARNSLGYTDAELCSVTIERLCPVGALVDANGGVGPGLTGGMFAVTEYEMHKKNGDVFSAEVRTRLLKIGDMNAGIVLFRDVSERKKTDRMLHDARDNAVRANRLKSEFLANVSHELRTPLNGILGMAKLIRKEKLPENAAYYLEMLINASNNLLEHVNDILDFAQIEPGVLRLRNVEFDFLEFIEKNSNLFRFMAEEKGLGFTCEIDPGITYNIVGDPLRLRQIIMNLISNAVKFTEKGAVSFTVSEESRTGGTCRIRFVIADTGIGIPNEKKLIIFDRFSQVNASFTREKEGLGLGLSIAAGLVSLMGGKIHLASEEQHGATFTIVIPFGVSERSSDRKGIPVPHVTEGMERTARILIAEDDMINNLYIRGFLEKNGFMVSAVGNGVEALKALEEHEYDLILMDVSMPAMSGIDAARIIRDKLKSRVPIIALTAHAFREMRDRCSAAGMDDFLSKPINEIQLLQLINKYLTGPRYAETGELM